MLFDMPKPNCARDITHRATKIQSAIMLLTYYDINCTQYS